MRVKVCAGIVGAALLLAGCSSKPTDRGQQYKDGKLEQPLALGLRKGEAGLKGHLKQKDTEERGGSSAYVPPDPAQDKQLIAAVDFLHGVQKGAANTAKTADPKPN